MTCRLTDLVWSDPEEVDTWAVSPRGAGWLFGAKVTSEVQFKTAFCVICDFYGASYCNGMEHACVCVCCVLKSAQGFRKLIFAVGAGKYKNCQSGDLDFDLENDVRGREILTGHISGNSQHRIKMFSVLQHM